MTIPEIENIKNDNIKTQTATENQATYTLAIAIEFLGTNYHGWQRQREVLGVQEALETAISRSPMSQ